jgi:hypothetical protein
VPNADDADHHDLAGRTIGVLGGAWRGSVTSWGAIQQWDGLPTLDWYVAADDRWHVPSVEPTVRQTRVEGTPVIETRVRVPNGDVVQRVFAIADHDGLTLIEVTNDSPLPVAVAFAGAPVLSVRPPAEVPIQGIELPAGSTVFPIGHHATITVALAHSPRPTNALPARLPTALQVARGWTATCDRASRLVLPDQPLVDAVVAARCELALTGPDEPLADPVGFLMSVDQLVRMTGNAQAWMVDVADAVAAVARTAGRSVEPAHVAVALDAAESIAVRADDTRAGRDLAKVRGRLGERATGSWAPDPDDQVGARFVAAVERRLAAAGDLLASGMPPTWLGQNFEVHGLPTGPRSTVSYAIRWHGDRPAVLWERAGGDVVLTASQLAPGWSTSQPTGEALWPAPAQPAAHAPTPAVQPSQSDDPVSFS